ncbi:MAG: L-seryl-tRNA(Sec) selenium transferase [Bacteroidales bacterium]
MASRIIPSIEQLRQRPALRALEETYGRDAVVAALREEADALRVQLASAEQGVAGLPADRDAASTHLEAAVARRLRATIHASLDRVVNATGVIIHTNLGRAPLADRALERVLAVARGYTNLEYDLVAGSRGRRDAHATALLSRLTGAEAALVVNNNAAATLLILAALGAGREVIVSRGELVEIGGGFRVPDVMAQSGAVLREVGTTNKTRAGDYEAAISERTALILRVHRSNFRIEGFTEQPAIDELVALGRRAGVPVVEDLGSGWMGSRYTKVAIQELTGEPTVSASIEAGVDVVCFSGDKLFGGPQAGMIIGRESLVDKIRRHPLMRALRVDKLTYAALEGTLLEYASGRAAEHLPVARMLAIDVEQIRRRAEALMHAAGEPPDIGMRLLPGASMVGGGSAPGASIPTCLLALEPRNRSAADIELALRRADPPVIARVENDRVLLDLRTVAPEEDELLVKVLREIGAGS